MYYFYVLMWVKLFILQFVCYSGITVSCNSKISSEGFLSIYYECYFTLVLNVVKLNKLMSQSWELFIKT